MLIIWASRDTQTIAKQHGGTRERTVIWAFAIAITIDPKTIVRELLKHNRYYYVIYLL